MTKGKRKSKRKSKSSSKSKHSPIREEDIQELQTLQEELDQLGISILPDYESVAGKPYVLTLIDGDGCQVGLPPERTFHANSLARSKTTW